LNRQIPSSNCHDFFSRNITCVSVDTRVPGPMATIKRYSLRCLAVFPRYVPNLLLLETTSRRLPQQQWKILLTLLSRVLTAYHTSLFSLLFVTPDNIHVYSITFLGILTRRPQEKDVILLKHRHAGIVRRWKKPGPAYAGPYMVAGRGGGPTGAAPLARLFLMLLGYKCNLCARYVMRH
jgi:hypothetical protein